MNHFKEIQECVAQLYQIAAHLEMLTAVETGPPWVDITGTLPTNTNPTHPYITSRGWNWWPLRHPDDITGLTIHHTMSHSPEHTARYCVDAKGYSSIQYHFWVSADDECTVYRCALPQWALWHDHTGAHPTTLSIGMAGHLHLHAPPYQQIEACTKLVKYLMGEYDIPEEKVKGHRDRYRGTVCPGWEDEGQAAPSGRWRDDFYAALQAIL